MKGEICSICCGREREETVDCPMTCEFLLESRVHEKPADPDFSHLHKAGVTEEYFSEMQPYIQLFVGLLLNATTPFPSATDNDLRECLQSAIRNRKTKESGLVYDGRPDNRVAAGIQDGFEELIGKFQQDSVREGHGGIKSGDELRILMLLEAWTGAFANGRRYSRSAMHSFMVMVAQFFDPDGRPPEEESTLLVNP